MIASICGLGLRRGLYSKLLSSRAMGYGLRSMGYGLLALGPRASDVMDFSPSNPSKK
jgi:hypothetical protein